MLWWRAVRAGARFLGPDWWRPWRSALLRWRMETYGVQDDQGRLLTAAEITPGRFRRFVAQRRRTLWRLLVWAATLNGKDARRWTRRGMVACAVLGVVAMAGCGRQPEPSSEAAAPSQDVVSVVSPTATPVDPSTVGSVVGTVSFQGEPPPRQELRMQGNPECSALHQASVLDESVLVADGRLQNVFVYVSAGLEGRTFAPPETPVTIDQRGCLYVPHVVGAQVNQPVLFLNSDPTLHNIHSYAKNSRGWNFGLPFEGMKQTKKIPAPEVAIQLKCDVHPWMIGYLGVVAHPYYAVTGADGRFLLKDLPPGTYTVEAWHERFGTQQQQVEVAAGQTTEAAFTFAAP